MAVNPSFKVQESEKSSERCGEFVEAREITRGIERQKCIGGMDGGEADKAVE